MAPVAPAAALSAPAAAGQRSAPKAKLSYKEQRELQGLPALIDELESEQREIHSLLAGSEVYVDEPQRVVTLQARNEAIETELMQALERWEKLGGRA